MSVNISGGALEFEASINLGNFEQQLARMNAGIASLTDQQNKQSQSIESFAKKASVAAAGFLSVTAAEGFVKSMIQVRGQFQQIEVAFTTMLKSKDAADKLMAQAVQLAAVTPFTLQEVASGAKQLLAYGFAAKDVTKNLETLGNIASGVGSNLTDIVYLYGTLKASGRVTQIDINQFAGRGIPIYQALADVMKINVDQVRSYVSAGKIGFPEVEKAFTRLTGPAGQFFNLMQEQSKTLTGQLSNLEDAWDRMLNDLGKKNEGLFATGISAAIDLVNNYQNVIDIIEVLIITYGAYRAALVLTSIASGVSTAQIALEGAALSVLRNGLLSTITSLEIFASASAAAALSVTAITAVLAAVALAIYSVVQSQSAQEIAQKAVNEAMGEGARAAESEKGKIEGLVSIIQSHKSSKEEQKAAYDALQSEMGNYLKSYSLEEVAAGKASGAIALFAGHVANLTIAEKEYASYKGLGDKIDELSEKGIKAVSKLDRLAQSIKNLFGPLFGAPVGDFSGLNADYFKSLFNTDAANEQIVKQQQEKYRKAQAELAKKSGVQAKIDAAKLVAAAKKEADDLQKQFNDLLAKGAAQNFDQLIKIAPNKDSLEKLQKALNDSFEALAPGDKAKDSLRKKIQAVTKIIADSYGTSTKEATQQANKRTAALNDFNKIEIAALAKGLDADAEAIKAIQTKYEEQRNKFKKLGFKPTDGIFTRINNSEKAETGSIKYDQDTKLLKESLEIKKNLQLEYEADIEKFGLDAAKQRYAGLQIADKSYYKSLLDEQKTIDNIPVKQRTGNQTERLKVVADLLQEETKRQRAADDELLYNTQGYYDKLNILETKYQADRKKLVQAGKFSNVDELDRQYKQDVESLQSSQVEKLRVIQKYNDNVFELTRREATLRLNALKELRNGSNLTPDQNTKLDEGVKQLETVLKRVGGLSAKYRSDLVQQKADLKDQLKLLTVGSEEWKKIFNEIVAVDSKLKDINSDSLKESAGYANLAAGYFSQLSQSVSGLSPGLSEVLGTLSKVSDVASNTLSSFASFSSGDIIGGISSAVSAVAGIFSLFDNSKEKAAAQAYSNQLQLKAVEAINKALERQLAITKDLYGPDRLAAYKKDLADIATAQKSAADSLSNRVALTGIKEIDDVLKQVNGDSSKLGGFIKIIFDNLGTSVSLAGKSIEELQVLLDKGLLDDNTAAIVQNMVDLERQARDTMQAIQQEVTGVDFSSLNDEIKSIFDSGEASAENFANAIEKAIRGAFANAFQRNEIEKAMKPFYDQLYQAGLDGTYTDEEIQALREQKENIAKLLADKAAAYQKIIGSDDSVTTSSTLTGQIRGITADQANLLAGQFNGLRLAAIQGNEIAINNGKSLLEITSVAYSQLSALNQIVVNTGKTADNTNRIAEIQAPMLEKLTNIAARDPRNDLISMLRAAGKI